MVGSPYLIFAILFSTLAVVQCIRWGNADATGVGCVLNFLPAMAFLVTCILSREQRRRVFHAVAIPLCVLVVGIWGCVTVVVEFFIDATAEVTNVDKYAGILDTYWDSRRDLVGHFPRPIPANARTVRFSFRPAFLQGGAHVQLRCSLPPEQIEEQYAYFASKRTKSFFGGNASDHMNMREGMPTSSFYTGDTRDNRFPPDYEIMIFDEVLKEENRSAGFYWNHARCHGVAISRERHEIVYWAEFW